MPMQIVIFLVVIFLAVFTQSLTGFGVALVSMALLAPLLGLQLATPLVALLSITLEIILLLYFRSALEMRAVWRLILASVVGVPFGVMALGRVDERSALILLGVVIIGYALYASVRVKLPELRSNGWAYLAGLLAGVLGGAYNTSGPPVIIYGDCRGWQATTYKANLQGFFLVSSAMVVVSHAWAGNLSPMVWQHYLLAWPAIGLGAWTGIRMGKRVGGDAFRKIVRVSLLLLGSYLVFFG